MSGTGVIKCPKCPKTYKLARNFEKHLQTHERVQGPGIDLRATVQSPASTQPSVAVSPRYQCDECPKNYKSQRGLKQHKLTHTQSSVVKGASSNEPTANSVSIQADYADINDDEIWPENAALESTEEVVSFFEEDDEEQEALLLASILGYDANLGVQQPQQQKPPSKAKKPPIALCSSCGTSYRTLEGYAQHRMSHATNDALFKAPPLDVVHHAAPGICKEVANQIFSDNINAESKLEVQLQNFSCKMKEFYDTPSMKKFLCSLCESLYACFCNGVKYSLPSDIRNAFLKGVSRLLANQEVRGELKAQLLIAVEIEDKNYDVNFFVCAFIRKFSSKLLVFIIQEILKAVEGPSRHSEYALTEQSLHSSDFVQLMHYIGGANVKSVLRNAWRSWGQNDECKMVISTVRGNFILSGPDDSDSPVALFMEWTLSQDRGKLIKINSKALDFFLCLSSIVKPLEHFDGSLILNEVIDNLSGNPRILLLWEDLIKESLPKKVSFKLLFSICEYFCNTWRSGIVRRRMDQLQSTSQGEPHGTRGVAFRPKVVKFST